MEKKLTVIKVGTSTLTYENGKINYRRIESLCKVIADLQNSGEQIILVSSGAIGVGMGKAGFQFVPQKPRKNRLLRLSVSVSLCLCMTNFSVNTTTRLRRYF